MKKLVVLITMITIAVSCREIQDKYLYDESDDVYPTLQEAAAVECISGNEIFNNLKTDDFTNYPILNKDNVIEVKNGDTTYNMQIISTTATKVVFYFYSSATVVAPYLNAAIYTIELSENNKLVDMIANGVCRGTFTGTPSRSTRELTFQADRYYITDSTPVDSNTVPGTFQRRQDSFRMNTNLPAFLFIWGGTITSTQKLTSNAEVTSGSVNTALELTSLNVQTCPNESVCTTPGRSITLTVNESEFAQTRTTDDKAVTRFYFNEFEI